MSHLRAGEPDDLHLWDGSHNWVAPLGVDQQEWRAVVAAHQAAHQENPGAGWMPWRSPS